MFTVRMSDAQAASVITFSILHRKAQDIPAIKHSAALPGKDAAQKL
jgi:hypothetical protein